MRHCIVALFSVDSNSVILGHVSLSCRCSNKITTLHAVIVYTISRFTGPLHVIGHLGANVYTYGATGRQKTVCMYGETQCTLYKVQTFSLPTSVTDLLQPSTLQGLSQRCTFDMSLNTRASSTSRSSCLSREVLQSAALVTLRKSSFVQGRSTTRSSVRAESTEIELDWTCRQARLSDVPKNLVKRMRYAKRI